MLCLVTILVTCLHAVQVQNNTPYRIKLKDFSFISSIENELSAKILKPSAMFCQNDIASFTIHTKGKSHSVENLKDDDYIIVTWSDDDLVVEFYNSTTTIHVNKGQEVLCYDEERDLFHVITKR